MECSSLSSKILLLGISYPDVKGHMAEHDYDETILDNKDLSVDQAVECVRRKILTEMDGRDLARCVATEIVGDGHEVYTVSKEMGGIYRSERHVYANFNNSRGMRRAMKNNFGDIKFQQVILDYYWMPTGWLVTRWAKTLFQETLPDLVRHNMLSFPSSRPRTPRNQKSRRTAKTAHEMIYDANTKMLGIEDNGMALEEGVVFLPFCAHVCKELVGGIHILAKYYAITFVKRSELPGHALWKGTMYVDGKIMQHRLGKRLDQEEVYCTFQPKDIYGSMEDAHVQKDEVMKMLLSIEDFENIRMIRLRPLAQHEPPSAFKKKVVKHEKGGFVGLNWNMGIKRFKEFRSRTKIKPSLSPPEKKRQPAKKKRQKPLIVAPCNSDSEVETVDLSDENSDSEVDTESDSSSDEESVCNEQKPFDPLQEEAIPSVTNYFPYPTFDLESYVNVKGVMNNDQVMTSWAETWGPKAARKKNRKQNINANSREKFRRKQRDYLSWNNRIRDPDAVEEDGYRWTLFDDSTTDDVENKCKECDWIGTDKDNVRRSDTPMTGWKLSLTGDKPDARNELKIIRLAKRDYELSACRNLFEMKNPGLKTCWRHWMGNEMTSCYQIPKALVLKKKKEAESASKKTFCANSEDIHTVHEFIDASDHDNDESDLDSLPSELSVGELDDSEGGEDTSIGTMEKASSPGSILSQFADLVSKAPVLSDDLLSICKGSKRFVDMERDQIDDLPAFKPKSSSNRSLPFNLDLHKNFPRELFKLLQEAEEKAINHIVCWQDRGRSFIVHHPESFETIVLRQCCSEENSSYESFIANISRYGFGEIRIGSRKGGYRHNLFQRGKPKRLDALIKESDIFLKPGKSEEPPESGSGTRKDLVENLHEILCKSESLGFQKFIHWEDGGRSFKVHKLDERFTSIVLKRFLRISDYDVLKVRLMMCYGFKCKEGKKYGIFEHSSFAKASLNVSRAFGILQPRKRQSIELGEKENKPTQKRKRVESAITTLNNLNQCASDDVSKRTIEMSKPTRAKSKKKSKNNEQDVEKEKRNGSRTSVRRKLESSTEITSKTPSEVQALEKRTESAMDASLGQIPLSSIRTELFGITSKKDKVASKDLKATNEITGTTTAEKIAVISSSSSPLEISPCSLVGKENTDSNLASSLVGSLASKSFPVGNIAVEKASTLTVQGDRKDSPETDNAKTFYVQKKRHRKKPAMTIQNPSTRVPSGGKCTVAKSTTYESHQNRSSPRKRKVCHPDTFPVDSTRSDRRNTSAMQLTRTPANFSLDKEKDALFLRERSWKPGKLDHMKLSSSRAHNDLDSDPRIGQQTMKTKDIVSPPVPGTDQNSDIISELGMGSASREHENQESSADSFEVAVEENLAASFDVELEENFVAGIRMEVNEKLFRFRLSYPGLMVFMRLFKMIASEERALRLGDVVFWRLRIVSRFEDENTLLANLLGLEREPSILATATAPESCKWYRFLEECIFVEMCSFEWFNLCGKNWCKIIRMTLERHFSRALPLLKKSMRRICDDYRDFVGKLLIEYRKRLLRAETTNSISAHPITIEFSSTMVPEHQERIENYQKHAPHESENNASV